MRGSMIEDEARRVWNAVRIQGSIGYRWEAELSYADTKEHVIQDFKEDENAVENKGAGVL